jgi:hypothetical protein
LSLSATRAYATTVPELRHLRRHGQCCSTGLIEHSRRPREQWSQHAGRARAEALEGEQPRRSKVFWRADDLNPTLVAFIELAGGVFTRAPIVA